MADQDRLRSRHAEALGTLVVERYGRMVCYASRRLRTRDVPESSADPEDVVQNALKAVLAHTESIDNVRAYVYKVMNNEIDRAARQYYTGRGYASLDADLQLEDEPAIRPIDEAERRHVINEALGALPPQQRKVMLLTREMGLTQTEAAQVMGTASRTVGVHAHRAIRALRVTLVGLGAALVVWTTGSMAFGVRQIFPAAGIETPVSLALTRSLSISVGLITIVLGLAIYLPGQKPRLPWWLRQWLLGRRVENRSPGRDATSASSSASANSAQDRKQTDYIDPADQWVLNPDTGEYELHLDPRTAPDRARRATPSRPVPGTRRRRGVTQ